VEFLLESRHVDGHLKICMANLCRKERVERCGVVTRAADRTLVQFTRLYERVLGAGSVAVI